MKGEENSQSLNSLNFKGIFTLEKYFERVNNYTDEGKYTQLEGIIHE